jgi:hypothetical protein
VVTFNGKDVYLGAYDSPESHAKYRRALAEWLVRGRQVVEPNASHNISVNDVILAYYTFALELYRSIDGTISREPEGMKLAFRPLKHLYGD